MITAFINRNWLTSTAVDGSEFEFFYDNTNHQMTVAKKTSDNVEIIEATETWDCDLNAVWEAKFSDGTMILFLWYAGESCKMMHRLPGEMFFNHSYYAAETTPFATLLKDRVG